MFTRVTQSNPTYPKPLLELSDPPEQIFLRGNPSLLSGTRVGIVGSRKMTSYGRHVLESIIPALVACECVIVSGLAFGVDVFAHALTLKNKGRVIAVLGSGINLITPYAHETIGNRIADEGLVVSEYPGKTPAQKHQFPARNRIIAGLSQVLIVIEGTKQSGSLITADFMMQLGRDVFAVPGNIDAPLSAGPNFLISCGAHPLLSSGDVLTYLGFDKPTASHVSSDVSPNGHVLLHLLQDGPCMVDELIRRSQLPVDQALEAITSLEMGKHIFKSSDGILNLAP